MLNKGSETEVTCDFVFESPQTIIGLQRSAFCRTLEAIVVLRICFYESNLTYVAVPFLLQSTLFFL